MFAKSVRMICVYSQVNVSKIAHLELCFKLELENVWLVTILAEHVLFIQVNVRVVRATLAH